MTTRAQPRTQVPDAAIGRPRLLALSGAAFVPLFLVGWFASAA
jgi:hypothetical protein